MAEGDALEKRYTGNGIVSSNLTPTANEILICIKKFNILKLIDD